ncbi:hypothetical protein SBRY_40678 [Actinacidiphila bryophytorum]|uniref:Uncharacterized protein n=1 Tax=Actinacidiphila bryophytorum TaxID=1436133 RepID=A0A9W4H3F2_9ACTN|nr:hypothetical protein SBRY_40678 [Actinacidiphila bryophytorum]
MLRAPDALFPHEAEELRAEAGAFIGLLRQHR